MIVLNLLSRLKIASSVIVLLLTHSVSSVNAQSSMDAIDADTAFNLATDFNACAGVYEAMSKYSLILNQDAMAEQMHGFSLGATTAAAMVGSAATTPEKAWAFAKDNRDTHVTYWWAIIQHEGLQGDKTLIQLQHCQELNELQTELVAEARKQTYGFQ